MLNIQTAHNLYLERVQDVFDVYAELSECDIHGLIGEMKDLQTYVSLSVKLHQTIMIARLHLKSCFRIALKQHGIPLNKDIVFKKMPGHFEIGETPSIFRPSLSAADLAVDGLSILFVRDGDEDKPSDLKVRPVFRLEEENYKNPDVFDSGMNWLKKHIIIVEG